MSNSIWAIVYVENIKCLGIRRDADTSKCHADCPDFEEYHLINLRCKDCPATYRGTKNYIDENICVASCPAPAPPNHLNVCGGNNCISPDYFSELTSSCNLLNTK